MESSPSYSPEERGRDRGRDGKERQPSPPVESMFVDPRREREEAPRTPLHTPLEGVVIHLRPVSEAVQGHVQEQFEQAEVASDKDAKRDKRSTPVPVQPQPPEPRPAPVEATGAAAEQPDEARPTAAEQEHREQESPQPTPVFEQPALPSQPQEDEARQPTGDGVQRAWYYTPPHLPAQSAGAEYPVPAYPPEQPSAEQSEPKATEAGPLPAPEAWHQDNMETPAASELAAEQPAVGVEPAPWHYDGASAPFSQSAEAGPYAAREPSQPAETPTPASVNPLFGARTPSPYEYATTAPSGGSDGPFPPRNSYEGSYGSPTPSPSERYAYASAARTPLARLRQFLRPPEQLHTHRDLALGIIGAFAVHLLAKRRDNKLSERINQLQKENVQSQKQTYRVNQELQLAQQALRAEQHRTQEEIAKLRTARQAPNYAPTTESRADVSGGFTYVGATPNRIPQPEQRLTPALQAEQQPGADPNQQEFIGQNGNVIRIRPDEHVRHSAWHTYVEKNGRVVEDAVDYGRALHEEQQQETGHIPQYDNVQPGAVPGPLYGPAQDVYGAVNPSLPSGMTAPSLPSGTPTHADPQHQLPEHTKSGKQIVSNFANPWFWLMLALIFAAFFITITV